MGKIKLSLLRFLVSKSGSLLTPIIAGFVATARGEPFPNGKEPSTRDIMDARRWLAEYGHGKAPAYAAIADADPLGQADDLTQEIARVAAELLERRERAA